MSVQYDYEKEIDSALLRDQVLASSIQDVQTEFEYIYTKNSTASIFMTNELSVDDKIILDTIVADHVLPPEPKTRVVILAEIRNKE